MPLWSLRGRHLLTVHDVTFFSMPGVYRGLHRSAAFRAMVRASVLRAGMINVPSHNTRSELLQCISELPAERVRVTPWGLDTRFSPACHAEVATHRTRLKLPERYVLFVGTVEPRKNLLTLLEGFQRFVSRHPSSEVALVIAGRDGWQAQDVYAAADSPELRGRVRFLGYVSDADLVWLYRGASLFAYLSLHEGFGFPPLEAMACGAPVLASRGSALEENLNGAADLIDPADASACEASFAVLLTDPARRDHLIGLGHQRASSFRWDRTARLVLDCYQELAAR
jgi:glycosyltransferase involved in cell wall biosynthesis